MTKLVIGLQQSLRWKIRLCSIYTMFPAVKAATFQTTVSHVSDHCDQNVINLRQCRANIAVRDNRGHRGKFFDSLKICHGNHRGNEKRNRS